MDGRAKQIANTARRGITHAFTQHPFVATAVALSILWIGYQFGGGVVSAFRSARTSAQVTATQAAAQVEQGKANDALTNANATSVERQINDAIREQTIKPEVERTARAARETNERVTRARASYEAAQTNNHRGDLDDRVLHERNCTDLAKLYPDERFERCER